MAMSLNHFSIRSLDLDACERFYCGLLGLTKGPRPPFPFPGLWLYAGDTGEWANAVIHIIGIDRNDPEGLKRYLGDRDESSLHGTGGAAPAASITTGLAPRLATRRAHGPGGRAPPAPARAAPGVRRRPQRRRRRAQLPGPREDGAGRLTWPWRAS